jgi:hypothetical protein
MKYAAISVSSLRAARPAGRANFRGRALLPPAGDPDLHRDLDRRARVADLAPDLLAQVYPPRRAT